MANRNRQAGILLELDVVRLLKELGFKAVTSRNESRTADKEGIDIISDCGFNIQCKAMVNQPNIHKLMTETKANAIVFRKMEKKKSRFYRQGDYVAIRLDDFLNLINHGDNRVIYREKP